MDESKYWALMNRVDKVDSLLSQILVQLRIIADHTQATAPSVTITNALTPQGTPPSDPSELVRMETVDGVPQPGGVAPAEDFAWVPGVLPFWKD